VGVPQRVVAVVGIGTLLSAVIGCGGRTGFEVDGSGSPGSSGSSAGGGADSGVARASEGFDATVADAATEGMVGDGTAVDTGSFDATTDGHGGEGASGDGGATAEAGGSPAPDACTPKTCGDFPGGTCDVQADGCGGLTASCGTCVAPQFCGGGGPGLCGGCNTIELMACQDRGYDCGQTSGGCGYVLQCGTCVAPEFCGGGGYNRCGSGGGCAYSLCQPSTCRQEAVECGLAGDGCGGVLDCGPCPPSETCSSDGKCLWPADAGPCVPATCASLGYGCGSSTDGCGGSLDCGACPVDQFCGGGGVRRCGGACSITDGGCSLVCSSPDGGSCTAILTALCSGQTCGVAPNGCGGLIDCGDCGGDAGG
jgi:hypothetical protein